MYFVLVILLMYCNVIMSNLVLVVVFFADFCFQSVGSLRN